MTATSALLAQASQAVVEAAVLQRVAHARARELLGLRQDPADSLLLTVVDSEVSEELDRPEAFSDRDAPRGRT